MTSGSGISLLRIFALTFVFVIGHETIVLADGSQTAQGQPKIDCTCRYQGQDFQLGDMICLKSPNGPQLARCGFVQNNTSWNFTGAGCVYSSATPFYLAKPGQAEDGPQPIEMAAR